MKFKTLNMKDGKEQEQKKTHNFVFYWSSDGWQKKNLSNEKNFKKKWFAFVNPGVYNT